MFANRTIEITDGIATFTPGRCVTRLPRGGHQEHNYEWLSVVPAAANHWHLVLWSRKDGERSRFTGSLTLTHKSGIKLSLAAATRVLVYRMPGSKPHAAAEIP